MYDFTLQKELYSYCDTVRDICSRVEEEKGYDTKFIVVDCYNEIKVKVFYVEGNAVAYYDGWEEELYALREKVDIELLDRIMEHIPAKIHVYLSESNGFKKELNKMMAKHGCQEQIKYIDYEDDDNKLWQKELSRQAMACNRGIV